MERQIATITPDGTLPLSAAIQSAIGVHPGSQLEISIEGGDIVLRPTAPDPIQRLRGMFTGQPSLEDDLMEWRREEAAHAQRKEDERC